MLVDQAGERVISAQGWNDRGSLWVLDLRDGRPELVALGDYEYLVPIGGDGRSFVVRAQMPGGGFVTSVRRFAEPAVAVAEVELRQDGHVEVRGEGGAWRGLPLVFAGLEPSNESAPYTLVVVAEDGNDATAIPLEWFNAETYDLMYQGVLTPIALPQTTLVLVPIQRSPEPVIFDTASRTVRGTLGLAGRNGNPTLQLRDGDLWADDYDTLLRLRTDTWAVTAEQRLQGGTVGRAGQFLGEWTFSPNREMCAVARPFSGDVVALSTNDFEVTHRADLGRDPLDVAVLDDGTVIARDWKTGDLLTGTLKAVGRRR